MKALAIPAPLVALFAVYALNTSVSKAAIEHFAPADATEKTWLRGHQTDIFQYKDARAASAAPSPPKSLSASGNP